MILAIHPFCSHFHSGSILTTNNSHVILKFFTNELGVHKIPYSKITILDFYNNKPITLHKKNEINQFSMENNYTLNHTSAGIYNKIKLFYY